MTLIRIGDLTAGKGERLLVISGPCVIESLDGCLRIGEHVKALCDRLNFSHIFKASFDKANRSSIDSPRGPGLEGGLKILSQIRDRLGVPVTTDIHDESQAAVAAKVVDLLQVPAFLCRQTDLLIACAAAGKPVNVKKGQFMSPAEMVNVVRKLDEAKASGVMLTERGTFFGYNRLVNDFVGLGDLLDLGRPVCFDVTHSTQQPGGEGAKSGGRPERAPLLARAAVAAGVHALFIETHPNPPQALSDGATMVPLDRMAGLLEQVARIREVV